MKLNFFTIKNAIAVEHRRALVWLSFFRILTNLLDVVGLAGIALLANVFSGFTGGSSGSQVTLPLFGTIQISAREAVIIASGVALLFLVKSGFAIWLNLQTALRLARVESEVADRLALHFFQHETANDKDSLSRFQNQVIQSSAAIGSFLNARYLFVAEISLLMAIVGVFVYVNPIASISLFIFLGAVLFALNKITSVRVNRNAKRQQLGYESTLQTTKDLFGIKREAQLAGVSSQWLTVFSKARAEAAFGSGVMYVLNGLPRYVVETSLILGIFAFLGGVVVFSDIPSQAVTIGIFMAGGLRLIASLLPIQAAWNQMLSGSALGQNAFSVLVANQDKASKVSDSLRLKRGALALELKNVAFSYSEDAEIIRSVSFKAEAGKKTALVGPSGAGKTTLFDLALGFREPSSGKVLLGGQKPIDLISAAPGSIALVPQRPQLVMGTLAENVSLVRGSKTDPKLAAECLTRAGLGHFLGTNNSGLDMEIKPDAGQLSGGEIQRLGLARALYRKPRILFLDEATSALDASTESQIAKMLDSLRGEMTIVLIAHRLSTVQNADKIIYLKDGVVEAEGTFKELKKKVPDFNKAIKLMELRD
jgi:ATP-binding cassette subfamily C protein